VEIGLAELTQFGVLKMFKIEHNVETGEIKQIELTPEEVVEFEQQYNEAKIKSDAEEAAAEAKAAQKAALLERLGITAEEAQLLLGGN
jgi:hypothetical protein